MALSEGGVRCALAVDLIHATISLGSFGEPRVYSASLDRDDEISLFFLPPVLPLLG